VKLRKLRDAVAIGALGCCFNLLLQTPAAAYLGGGADSVAADRDSMRGQLRSTSMLQYEVHEISLTSTNVVREYATASGKVFAVTWRGMTPPDLRQLFGSYFAQYQGAAAAQVHPGMHRQLQVTESDLVVLSSGHMRAFEGRAYVPSLVPAGVNVSELQ
jgi:hypothetical protein